MQISSEITLNNNFTAKIKNNANYFWLGFVIYTISYSVYITFEDSGYFIIFGSLQSLGIVLMVLSSIGLIRWKFNSDYLKVTFSIYMFWMITIVMRGFLFDFQFIKDMLFNPIFGIFLYLTPLVLLFPRDIRFYKKVFEISYYLNIAYLLLVLFFSKDLIFDFGTNVRGQNLLENFSRNLGIPGGILLLTYNCQSKKKRLLALLVIVVTLIISIIRARRGLLFMSVSILAFSFYLYYSTSRTRFVVFIFSIFLFFLLTIWGIKLYMDYRSTLFNNITTRISEDTRSQVHIYFMLDMDNRDWIIGKGINGKYYCPGIDNITGQREVIETGFLQIILKGGIISLVLLMLIIIPAIFKGLFYSRNLLSKAAAVWLLLFLLFSYPGIITTFTLHYIFVWISIGICYSQEIRSMPDNRIVELLSMKSI